jgi:hypothetical protein
MRKKGAALPANAYIFIQIQLRSNLLYQKFLGIFLSSAGCSKEKGGLGKRESPQPPTFFARLLLFLLPENY